MLSYDNASSNSIHSTRRAFRQNIDKPCPQSQNTQTRGRGTVPIMQWVIDPLLHDHVGLPHVLVLAVHLHTGTW